MTGKTGKGGLAQNKCLLIYEVVVLQSYKLSANILNVLTHPNHVGSHYTFYMIILFWAAAVLKFVEQSTANEVGRVIILWTLLHSESFLAC